MKMIRLFTAICLLLVASMVTAQDTSTEGASLDDRGYGLYVPPIYEADGDDLVPLVIALHGFGDTWQNFFPTTGLTMVANQENFIVAFPQGYLNQWNDGSTGDHYEDDVQILKDLIERVDRDYRVDLERVYLVGYSNGGIMTFRAACEAPETFAGIASIAGALRVDVAQNCSADATLPVLMINGVVDTVIPFGGNDALLPAQLGLNFWTAQNDCDMETGPSLDNARFNGAFANFFFEDCADGNIVMLHALQTVGHTYPGAESYVDDTFPEETYLDSARLIWGFFDLSYQAGLSAQENTESTPEATEAIDD